MCATCRPRTARAAGRGLRHGLGGRRARQRAGRRHRQGRQRRRARSISPPTRTARARRSPGTCAPCWTSKRALQGRRRQARSPSTRSPSRPCSDAVAHPRDLDQPLIDAYLARRALDYLVGFTLSPVLWRKLPGSRSAGRVQSVALRLICEREAEIEIFRPREYWTVEAQFLTAARRALHRPPDPPRRRASSTSSTCRTPSAPSAPSARSRRAASPSPRSSAAGSSATRRRRSPPRPCSRRPRRKLGIGAQATMRMRAATLRRRRDRRRDRRPDHLYAHRRRADGARGDAGDPRPCRARLRPRLPAGRAARIHRQGQERAGGARGDPPDRRRRARPSRSRAT